MRCDSWTGRVIANRITTAALAWQAAAVTLSVLMLAPLLVAAGAVLVPNDVWPHLAEHVLPRVLGNTIVLVTGVGVLTLVIGTSAAWLVNVIEFPGRRWLSWALLLPLALPGYVIAFALSGVFGYSGPLAGALREVGVTLPQFGGGAAALCCLVLTLYPYVYLLAGQAFRTQGRRSLEVARSLGMTTGQGFWRLAVPAARPWLVAGVSLVLMETLADFGTVKVFNFDTFTTAIYSAWFGLFSLTAALQLSCALLATVLLALLLERRLRGHRRFTATSGGAPARIKPRRWQQWLATGYCVTLFALAFAIPVAQLLVWAAQTVAGEWGSRYFGYLRASLVLASLAAFAVTAGSLLLGYSRRQAPGSVTAAAERLATLGYALPGTVLAVGFYVVVAGVSRATGLALTGTIGIMLLAYAARFLAVAHGPLGSAFERITPAIDDAARSLGVRRWRLLGRVHLPMLRGGIATAALLVFVDVMKELPITLITRPFGWDTLAVRVFQMTTEGEWLRAAVPALVIVIAGLVPVVWLQRRALREAH